MFIRSILIPSLLVCAISAPFLLSERNVTPSGGVVGDGDRDPYLQNNNSSRFASFAGNGSSNSRLPNAQTFQSQSPVGMQNSFVSHSRNLSAQTQYARSEQALQQAALPVSPNGNSMVAVSNFNQASVANQSPENSPTAMIPFGLVNASTSQLNATNPWVDAFSTGDVAHLGSPQMLPQTQNMMPTTGDQMFAWSAASAALNPPSYIGPEMMPGMTPDYGAAQTFIFSGNAYGPDLDSAPLEFMPINDFNEIFRFDITSEWVKQRWKRVSTNPGDTGLHGLRVALVTGTNSWDLHGSLTYFFDSQQRLQRITFRGWTGDAARLLQLLTLRYQFAAQPSHLAGFYVSRVGNKTLGGLLMKNPPVINSENPVQQLAIVMEINNPQGSFEMSEEFHALIAGSTSPLK